MRSSSLSMELKAPDPTPLSWLESLRLKWSAGVLKRLLSYTANNPNTLAEIGHVYWFLEQYATAISYYERALAAAPNSPVVLMRCGVCHSHLGQLQPAMRCFELGLKLAPRDAEFHYRRATVLCNAGQAQAGLEGLQRALELEPDYPQALNEMALVLISLGRFDEAIVQADRALALRPHFARALNNRGLAKVLLARYEQGLSDLNLAIAQEPRLYAAYANRGLALMWLDQRPQAQADFEKALALRPQESFIRWNMSLLALLEGRLSQAWPLFESRWDSVLKVARRDYPRAVAWRGEEPIAGKTILIYPEQGLGDFIQFCRYVPKLVERGAKVVLETPSELLTLAQSLGPQIKVVAAGSKLPGFDLHCSVMSLPGAFGVTLQNIGVDQPYLAVQPDAQQRWAQRLGERSGPRIGLVWSGGKRPDQPTLWAVNERRNIPLKALEGLQRPGVSYYSLQLGADATAQWDALQRDGWQGPQLQDFTAHIKDFHDTAALITQLDLVIAVDTSTAHLAAALGKPVWLLNRFDTCWRWGLSRSDSPWYPSMRIFRQVRSQDWSGVIAPLQIALDDWLQSFK